MLRTTLTGSYPRVSDQPLPVNLRQTLHRHDRGEASDAELEHAYRATITRIVKEQDDAGIDLLTDGQVRWDDLLTPFTRQLEGAEVGGLLRFFDNNVYYRHPIVTGPLRWRGPATVQDNRTAAAATSRPVKAVVPGPVTFAALSEDRYYHDFGKLAEALAAGLREEAMALDHAGVPWIQVDEPALGGHADWVPLARTCLDTMTGGLQARVSLATYFRPVEAIWSELRRLPVHAIQVDVADRPAQLDLVLQAPPAGELVLGCIDARNTRLEERDPLVGLLERAAERIGANRLWVSPNCGLEFLPHAAAQKKMARLVEAVAAANNRTAGAPR